MGIIRDYGESYKTMGSDQFCTFYKMRYETLKKKAYLRWILPTISFVWGLGEAMSVLPALYRYIGDWAWLLVIVGALCSCAMILDKWPGTAVYAVFLGVLMCTKLIAIPGKVVLACSLIMSVLTMMVVMEIHNLESYFRMAKYTLQNKVETRALEEIENW